MTTLLENQYHPSPGPLAVFFASLDVQGCGSLTKRDIHLLVDQFCAHQPLSFVQKKLLLVMLSQGFSRCASQNGLLSWSDIMVFAPRLLLFFGQPVEDTHLYAKQVAQRFQDISSSSSTLSFQRLTQHCESNLPRMCPNKKLLSAFLAYNLCILCSGSMQITEQMWCDTAIALLFEINAHR